MQMDNDIPQYSGNWIKTSGFAILILIQGLAYAGNIPETEINPTYLDRVVNAVYIAEGGVNAKKPFGILSVQCEGKKACERICRNTVRNNWRRWQKKNNDEDFISKSRTRDEAIRGRFVNGTYYTDFVSFLGSRYAPLCYNKKGCNDKNNLNKNWVKNVKFFLK